MTLPEFKFQRRPRSARLDPDADDFQTKVVQGSWKPHKMIGCDTETLLGYCRMFSYEQKVVSGWNANRKPTGYHYVGKVIMTDSWMDCVNAFISTGYPHTKTTTTKKGKKKTSRTWVCPAQEYWNKQYDAQAYLKWLKAEGKSELIDDLLMTGECTYVVDAKKEQSITITMLLGKHMKLKFNNMAVVKKGKAYRLTEINLWDMSQFYFKTPLTVAGQKELGIGKMETCFDGSRLDASRFGDMVLIAGERFPYDTEDYTEEPYWDYYLEDIKKYAAIDAEICGKLARKKRDEYVEAGVRFINPYSPANVSQTHILDLGYDQTVNLMESNKKFHYLMEMGSMAYHGGNFDVAYIGSIPDCVQVDLVSAYPYVMRTLPALMEAHVVEDEEGKESWKERINGYIVKGDENNMEAWNEWMKQREAFSLGFIYVDILFPEGQMWYPLLADCGGTLSAPRHFKGVITADELVEALKWNPDEVSYGEWVFHQMDEEKANYPFQMGIDRLYRMKMESPKDSAKYKVSKVAINSLYGKTLQAVDNVMGKLWNIGYGAVICGATRARLAEINRLNGKTAISMATDGVVFKKDDLKVIPDRPVDSVFNLGEWELDAEGDVIILGSGVYSFVKETEDYSDPLLQWASQQAIHKTTVRGSAKLFMRKHGFSDWRSFCRHFSGESELVLEKARPLSLKQSRMKGERIYEEDSEGKKMLKRIKGDYDHVNIFTKQDYSLKPFGDSTKRLCPVRPPTFGDLLTNCYELLPHESRATALAAKKVRLAVSSETEVEQ